MKNLKRLFALLLTLAIMMSMAVTVGAIDTSHDPALAVRAITDTGILTLKNATAGSHYQFYRILDIAEIAPGGVPVFALRTDAAGLVWEDFIKTVTIQVPTKHEDGTITYSEPIKCFEVSGGYVKTVGISVQVHAQLLAEKVAEYAAAKSIPFDFDADMTVSGDYTSGRHRQYGYYVMSRENIDADTQHSVFVLMTGALDVQEKSSSEPSITKFVQEDSEAGNGDEGWKYDTAEEENDKFNVAEIEQDVTFKIIVDLKPGTDTYIIEDTMPSFEGLGHITFDYSGGDFDTSDYTLQTRDSAISSGVVTGFTLTLTPDFRKTVEKNQTLTIRYTAKLKPDCVIGGAGNINTVTLTYGANGEKHLTDTTYTKTYKLHVEKVDEAVKPLNGATFKMYRWIDGEKSYYTFDKTTAAAGGELIYTVTNEAVATTDDGETSNTLIIPRQDDPNDTTDKACFHIHGLDTVDTYYLEEVSVPEDYVKMEDLAIVINPTDTAFNAVDQTYYVTIQNLPGVDMPTTGGTGTTIFYIAGGLLTAAALILLVTKKRMGA